MLKALIKFLRVGTSGVSDDHLKRCIIAINSCCMFGFPIILICALYYLICGYYALILSCVPFAAFFGMIYILNIYNKIRISQHMFLTGINLMIFSGTFLLGRNSNVYLYHYSAIAAMFTIFQPEDRKSFFWGIIPPLSGLILSMTIIPKEPSIWISGLNVHTKEALEDLSNVHVFMSGFIIWGLGFVIMGIVDIYHKQIIRADAVHLESSRMAALKVMSAGIAHEVNNPLAIISSRARQLRVFVERGDFKLQKKEERSLLKVSENIDLHVKRIAEIISGLRTFAVDEKSLLQQEASIKDIIEKCMVLANQQAHKELINLTFEIEKDCNVICIPSQLMHVFLNLISNSIDAIRDQDDKWIKITIEQNEGNVKVAVIDSGRGISKELQEKIMQPFFTTKEIGKGTGLGLSVALGVVKNHDGDLYIDDQSQFTKFVVELPTGRGPAFSKIA